MVNDDYDNAHDDYQTQTTSKTTKTSLTTK